MEDGQLAEALGIRYGDVVRRSAGIEERHRRVAWCTDSLLTLIASIHHVERAAVQQAARQRDPRADLVTLLPMAAALGAAAWIINRRVRRRFAGDGLLAMGIATLYFSLLAGGLALLVGELWAWTVESFRLRDDHLSYRVARVFWMQHRLGIFLAALLLFWAASLLAARLGRPIPRKPWRPLARRLKAR